jgi:crotonobetainyl-CoA:carnitine CoA-transferase CaiB-like acyl-CoA transferase
MKHYPAYDHNMQAMSGMMSLNGDEGDPYMKVGFPLIDSYAGFTCAFAILAALRQRDQTGEAQRIDVAMLDVAMVLMTSMVVPYMNAGKEPPRTGNRGYSGSPTADIFRCADGQVSLGANWPFQYEALCRAIGAPELIEDPRFLTKEDRIANDSALRELLEAALVLETGKHWEGVLNAAGVPTSKVRSVGEACALDQLRSRNLFQAIPVSRDDDREVRVLNTGFVADGWNGVEAPPPLMGEHGAEILARLGYDRGAIDDLKARNVVG